jgi:hypothetical protein
MPLVHALIGLSVGLGLLKLADIRQRNQRHTEHAVQLAEEAERWLENQ